MNRAIAGIMVGMLITGTAGIVVADEPGQSARDVAAAYFAAMENSDLDAAGALFASDSIIFETGGVEGTWQHYREHHLGPEIDAIAKFSIDLKEPDIVSSEDSSLTAIAWPVEYTIVLKDGRTIRSRGTVTFVLGRVEQSFKIRQLHWSSQRIASGS